MPNIITHVLFAQEVQNTCLLEKEKERIQKHQQLYEIGANGPDYLFFHGFNIRHFERKSHMRRLGTVAHNKGVNDFYHSAFQSILQEKDEEIKEREIVYLCGHLAHWALDSTAHPYIYYRTGTKSKIATFCHHKIESLIDAIMLKDKKGMTIKDYKVFEICDSDVLQAQAIARIYIPIARNIYQIEAQPYEIVEALNDWHFMQKLLYDGGGKKVRTLQKMEALTGMHGAATGLIIPNEPYDPCDVCNLLHKQWVHPCDKTNTSTDSFFDLYDKAMPICQQAIALFLRALDTKDDRDWLDYLANRNYTEGLDVREPMIYFDPDLESNSQRLLQEK